MQSRKDEPASQSTPAIAPKARSIALYKEGEVALSSAGPHREIAESVNAFPWLEMKQRVARAVCWMVETRPATAYDNFARDFGERFMPGYKRRGPRITANLVLHCFQEKTRKTSQQDLDLAAKRFKSIRVKS